MDIDKELKRIAQKKEESAEAEATTA